MIKIIYIIDQCIKIALILQIKIIWNKSFLQYNRLSPRIDLCYFSFTMHDIITRNIIFMFFSQRIIIQFNYSLTQQTIFHIITIPVIHYTTYILLYVPLLYFPHFLPNMPRT